MFRSLEKMSENILIVMCELIHVRLKFYLVLEVHENDCFGDKVIFQGINSDQVLLTSEKFAQTI